MATVGNLVVRIGADTGGLVRGGKQATRELAKLDNAAARSTKRLAALGAAAAAAAAAALFTASKRAIEFADNIGKTARAIGVTAEELQELRHAADRAGVSQSQFDSAMQRFTRGLGEAANGTGTARRALEQLGLSMEDLQGKSPAEALQIVADRAKGIEDPMRRASLMSDMFGRSGQQMALMLAGGSHEIERMRERARDLGVVLSNDMIARSEQANDQLSDMSDVLRTAGLSLALEFMPAMQAMARLFTDGSFQAGVKFIGGEIATMIDWMSRNEQTIIRVAGALAGMKVGRFAGLPGMLAGGITGALTPEIIGMGESEDETGQAALVAGLQRRAEELRKGLEGERETWTQHLVDLEEIRANVGAASAERELQQMAARLQSIREHLMDDAELHQMHHQERLEDLQAAFDAELVSAEEYHHLREALEAEHQDSLAEIIDRGARARAAIENRARDDQLRAAGQFFGDMASVAQAGGEKAFAAQKAIAAASAAVAAIESAVHAYNFGSRIGGPVVGAAMAATAAAAQMARVAQIRSASPRGGGGGVSTGSSGGATSATAAQTQSPGTVYHVNLPASQNVPTASVEDLFRQMNEHINDGGWTGRIVVARA